MRRGGWRWLALLAWSALWAGAWWLAVGIELWRRYR
jgi:hypothetical protein